MRLRSVLSVLVVSAALVASFAPKRASAGPWTRDQWHFYLGLTTGYTFADQRFDVNGDQKDITVRKFSKNAGSATDVNRTDYQQLSSDLYFELGLLKRLTFFGDIVFTSARMHNIDITGASVSPGDLQYATSKMGDTLLGLRYGVLLDPIAIAIEARFTLPTGDSTAVLPTGSGDVRSELRLAIGKAFQRVPIYFDAEVGFTYRSPGEVADLNSTSGTKLVTYRPEISVHGEIGGVLLRWKRQDRLSLIFSLDYRTSTSHAKPGDVTFELVPSDSEFTTLGPSLVGYLYKGLGVMARYSTAVQGRRLPDTTTVSGSLFYNY